jgi:hypothetical protein
MDLNTERLPVFLPRSRRYVVGVDLGQSQDPTTIAVLEKITGVHDFRPAQDRHCNIIGPPQKPAEEIHVRHLERLPLGLPYPTVVSRVGELMARPPLCGGEGQKPAELVIDDTGPGKPVGDIFVQSGFKNLVRVSITAGNEVAQQGGGRWNVAKQILVSKVDALLNTGELKFAAALTEADAMKEELKDFRRKLSETGRATYAARVGRHDDLILAVAISCFWVTRPPPACAQFTTYGLAGPGEPTQYVYGGE